MNFGKRFRSFLFLLWGTISVICYAETPTNRVKIDEVIVEQYVSQLGRADLVKLVINLIDENKELNSKISALNAENLALSESLKVKTTSTYVKVLSSFGVGTLCGLITYKAFNK